MRTTNPLITILPAMPPGISEIEHTPGKGGSVLLMVVAILLVLIALGAALMLSLSASSV